MIKFIFRPSQDVVVGLAHVVLLHVRAMLTTAQSIVGMRPLRHSSSPTRLLHGFQGMRTSLQVSHVGGGWGIRNGAMAAVRLP